MTEVIFLFNNLLYINSILILNLNGGVELR